MQKKDKRVPTQVHTRKIDRGVAKTKMKEKGVQKMNKDCVDGSFFSRFWRSYAGI